MGELDWRKARLETEPMQQEQRDAPCGVDLCDRKNSKTNSIRAL
jgi:hypothetical protein